MPHTDHAAMHWYGCVFLACSFLFPSFFGFESAWVPLTDTFTKADNVKIALAKQLRKETTMPLKWIASKLHMGTWTYVSNLLAANQ